MADTTSTTAAPSVKKYYDYAQEAIDEQALLDKYNAATVAQFNAQREQNRQNENNFYNQMYNTQRTAMDTIRQSNAAAVASGASRGVQAAQELSSLLGLQQESVASATELAQANRQTAQEETAAVLENVLNAYQQATQQRQQLVQQGIESASVDVQQEANNIAAQEAAAAQKQADAAYMQAQAAQQETQASNAATLVSAAENGTAAYLTALQQTGLDYSTEATTEGLSSLQTALNAIATDIDDFSKNDWDGKATGKEKATTIKNTIEQICVTYGISGDALKAIQEKADDLVKYASRGASWIQAGNAGKGATKTIAARTANSKYNALINAVQSAYLTRIQQNLNKK